MRSFEYYSRRSWADIIWLKCPFNWKCYPSDLISIQNSSIHKKKSCYVIKTTFIMKISSLKKNCTSLYLNIFTVYFVALVLSILHFRFAYICCKEFLTERLDIFDLLDWICMHKFMNNLRIHFSFIKLKSSGNEPLNLYCRI